MTMFPANISRAISSNGTLNDSHITRVALPGPHLNSREAQIIYYVKLFFIIIGFFGNFLSCYIWTTKYFRRVPHSVVCFTLALTNTLYLTIHFTFSTMDPFSMGDIPISYKLPCQVFVCLLGFSLQMDSWLTVLLSIERTIGVFSQRLAKNIFNRLKALIYVLLITIILLIYNIYFAAHHVSSMERHDGSRSCRIDIHSIQRQIMEYMIGLIPVSVIIPCNILIITKVIFQIRSMNGVIAVTEQQVLKKKSIKVTILTLSITLNFLTLTLPMNVIALCCIHAHDKVYFAVLVTLLPFINSSIDCYMYALSSREFRRKITSIFVSVTNFIWTFWTLLCAQNVVAPVVEDIPI